MSDYLWPISFLITAIVFVVLEMLIPSGGLLGVISTICFLASIIAAFISFGMIGAVSFLLLCVFLLPAVIGMMIKFWPKTPMGKRILIQPRRDDQIIPERQRALQDMVGKTGISLSSMLPSGALRVEGRLVDAVSEGMSIEKGMPVEIIAVRGNHLVVRPTQRPLSEVSGNNGPTSEQTVDSVIPDPFDDPLT